MRMLFALLIGLVTASHAMAADKAHPNIIFILADDLGPGDIGCYGGTLAKTPNIDRLAKEGICFEQYYVASPVCSPSRCALITGQFPARWQITSYLAEKKRNIGAEMADFLDPKAPSLPRQLKQAGYRTAHFGKWHLGGGRDVTDAPKFAAYGYDEHAGTYESPEPDPDITATNWIWSPKDKYKRWERTRFFVDKTLDFLKRNDKQPCFVNLWFDDVHSPWIPDAEAQKDKNPNVAKNLKPVITEMDHQVGRLLDGIKALGIEDNTLVIFTSDNGPYPHLRGRTVDFRGCKFSLYEGGLRLPFIARWPGVIPADVVDKKTVLASVDMSPTLCHIAGTEIPKGAAFDGVDLSNALWGKQVANRERPLMWEYGRNAKFFGYPKLPDDRSPNLAIRDGDWKLLVNTDGENAELYNLAFDPSEAKNLAEDEPVVALRLKNEVLKWRKSMPSTVKAAHRNE